MPNATGLALPPFRPPSCGSSRHPSLTPPLIATNGHRRFILHSGNDRNHFQRSLKGIGARERTTWCICTRNNKQATQLPALLCAQALTTTTITLHHLDCDELKRRHSNNMPAYSLCSNWRRVCKGPRDLRAAGAHPAAGHCGALQVFNTDGEH